MPSQAAAVFCTNKGDLENLILQIVEGELTNVPEGKKWFKTIVGNDPANASKNIWNRIDEIMNSCT
jgi:hypothetical protein